MRLALCLALCLALLAAAAVAGEPELVAAGPWRIEVHDDGGLGRRWLDLDLDRARAAWGRAADAYEGPVRHWRTEVFVFRKTDVDWTTSGGQRRHTAVEMTAAEIEFLGQVAARFAETIRIYSGGRLVLDVAVHVLDAPLERISGRGRDHLAWVDATDAALAPHVPVGAVDSVIVYWKAGDVEVGTYWGGSTGGAYRGAGYTSIALLSRADVDPDRYLEVTVHEWLHQLEWARSIRMGYRDLPALHDGQTLGYRTGTPHPGEWTWLRDVLTVYTTPAMWRSLSMRTDARPGRPTFEGGHPRRWLVLAPLAADDALADAADLAPTTGVDRSGRSWRTVEARAGTLDLGRSVALVHAYVHSPERRELVRLWVGAGGDLAVWVNGRPVHRRRQPLPHRRDHAAIEVDLEAGWNRLLFRVGAPTGGGALSARLAGSDGAALPGLRWTASLPAGARPARPRPVARPEATFSWTEIADDPWRRLPILDEADLRAAVGDPDLRLEFDGPVATIGPFPTPANGPLDRRLDPAVEALAVATFETPDGPIDLVLVRPDAADLLAAVAWPAVVDRLIGRLALGPTPLLVARTRLPRDDAGRPLLSREVDLLAAGDAGLGLSLTSAVLALGSGAEVELVVRAAAAGRVLGAEFELDGVALDALEEPGPVEIGPDRPVRLRYRLAVDPPPGRRRLRVRLEAALGDRPAAVELERTVEIVDALAVDLLGPDGRPWIRAASRSVARPTLVVENRTAGRLAVDVEATLPDGWTWAGGPASPIVVEGRSRRALEVAIGIGESTGGRLELAARSGDAEARLGRTWVGGPWWFVGPLGEGGRPESRIRLGATVDTPWGPRGWVDLVADRPAPTAGRLDLASLLAPGPTENVRAWAAIDLLVERAGRHVLIVEATDSLELLLDGRPVHRFDPRRGRPGPRPVALDLAAGRHRLLAHTEQRLGEWSIGLALEGDGARLVAPAGDR